jgi:hypothetical protein
MVLLMVLAAPFGAGTIMTLTHLKITHAKARERAYKLADADALYLVVNPNGTKLWRMNYRYLGKQKTLHFGEWPTADGPPFLLPWGQPFRSGAWRLRHVRA